jgi:HTH-type transcriptional regulator/antitoxin HipB
MKKNQQPSAAQTLGQIIRSERKKRNLTQTALGDLSGTSINFISQIESGKDTAQVGKVLKVLQILGVQLEALYGSQGLLDRRGERL